MALRVLQRSFGAGELSEEVYGRADISRYPSGLALSRNCLTLPHGPIQNRAGFGFVIETKDSTKLSVVLPFSFNDQQTYAIEFGNQYIRFHTQGGTLLEAAVAAASISVASPAVWTKVAHGFAVGNWLFVSGVTGTFGSRVNNRYLKVGTTPTANTFTLTDLAGVPINSTGLTVTAPGSVARVYEISSPYLEEDLYSLHIAQSADVLTITHEDYAPRELSRLAAAIWTLNEITFVNGPFLDRNTDRRRYVWSLDKTGALPVKTPFDGTTGDVSLYSDDPLFEADDVGRLFYVGLSEFDIGVGAGTKQWEPGKIYAINAQVQFGNNFYIALNAATSGAIPPVHTSGVVSDGDTGVLWRYLHSGFGVAKVTQYVSPTEVKATVQLTLPFTSQGGYLNAALSAHTPAFTYTLSGNGTTTEFPIATADAARAPAYRVRVGGIRQTPYDEYYVDPAANKIYFFIAPPAGVNNIVIEEYAGGGYLTTNWAYGAWSAESGFPACVSYYGGRLAYAASVEEPQNIWISRAGLYKDFGALSPALDNDAIDIALADRQINKIRDLVALDNLVALTSSRAWAIVGNVDNVLTPAATARPGSAVGISYVQAEVVGNHALYVDSNGNAIRKLRFGTSADGTEGYIADDLSLLAEHLTRDKTIVDIAYQRRPYPTLWCVRDDGALLSMSYSPEQDVLGWSRHDTQGFFESVTCINEGTEDAVYVTVRREVDGRTVRYVERLRSRRYTALENCFFVDAGATYSGAPTTTVTGLWHLEGKAVIALADGAVVTQLTVTAGAITLPAAASVVHVGLAYVSDIQSLPLAAQLEALAQGRKKNVNKLFLRFINSSAVQAGAAFDLLNEVLQRTDEPYGTPPRPMNGIFEVPFDGTWTEDAQVCIRQENPLPMMVSASILDVAIGG